MKALVTGATGLIGRHLVPTLDYVRVLARDPDRARTQPGVAEALAWDAGRPFPPQALRDIDVVFHLCGEPIALRRWTAEMKQSFRDSRVLGTRHLLTALRETAERPRVLVSASAIGFYGARGEEVLTERSSRGSDFLSQLGVEWEEAALAATELGVRVVCARIGIVLARNGGALASMRPAFGLGLGGPLGSGKQWMSWIHVDDVVGLLRHAAEHETVRGPMNVCSPSPERNAAFAKALGRAMHRPAWVRAPGAALRIAFGELADVVLGSQRVLPEKAKATGYTFRFESLDLALHDLFSNASEPAPRQARV
jgi:uncharacterized protein (TIGR01777 family)